MTDLIIPDDPAGRLAWARDVLRHREEFIGIVSGAAILRSAASIFGGEAITQTEAYIEAHKRQRRDSDTDADSGSDMDDL